MRGLTDNERIVLSAPQGTDLVGVLEQTFICLLQRGLMYKTGDVLKNGNFVVRNTTLGNRMLEWDKYARNVVEV